MKPPISETSLQREAHVPSPADGVDHFGKQTTRNLRDNTHQTVEAEKALKKRSAELLDEMRVTRDELQGRIYAEQPPAYDSFPGQSPAVTLNTIMGVIKAAAFLGGMALTQEQIGAIEVLITAVLLVLPVVVGYVIKAINSKRL